MNDDISVTYEVQRLEPRTESQPHWQSYTVAVAPGMTVLEGLLQIREHQDATLTWRFSCRMGVCGSCAMIINGTPGLACNTQILDVSHQTIRLQPLASFPVGKDLLVDSDAMLGKHRKLKPYVIREPDRDAPPEGDYAQSPEDLLTFLQFADCIKCGACMSACPTLASDPEFAGPMPLTQAHRYNSDTRDQGFAERRQALANPDSLSHCHYAAECSRVCPKGVDPGRAIALLRRSLIADAMHVRSAHGEPEVLGPGDERPREGVPQPPGFTVQDP